MTNKLSTQASVSLEQQCQDSGMGWGHLTALQVKSASLLKLRPGAAHAGTKRQSGYMTSELEPDPPASESSFTL